MIFYIDESKGVDDLSYGSRIYPYKTIEYCVTANPNAFNENVTMILGEGTYALNYHIFNIIKMGMTITIQGRGLKTNLSLIFNSSTIGIGDLTSTIIFKKLVIINNNQPQYVYVGNSKLYWLYYISTYTALRFYNVILNLTKISFDYAGNNNAGLNPYFFRATGAERYFENCIALNHNYLLESNSSEISLHNCYGKFTGTNTNWTKINTIITSTVKVDNSFSITDTSLNSQELGVYYGINNWNFFDFMILMGSNYYSLQEKYYDLKNHEYIPLTQKNMDDNGFNSYTISDMSDFVDEKTIGGETIIISPVMTSNTTPSPYIVSASSIYNSTYPAWKAFNGTNSSSSDAWITASGATTGWLSIDLASPVTINSFKMSARYSSDITASPKNFSLSGSNNGTDYTLIKSFTGETGWKVNETRLYNLDVDVTYRYYRLDISANNGQTYTLVGELQLLYINPLKDTFRPIDKFDNFRIISNGNNYVYTKGIKTMHQLIIESGSNYTGFYEKLDSLTINGTISDTVNDSIKIVVSVNDGTTWMTWNGTNWDDTDIIIPLKEFSTLSTDELVQWNLAISDILSTGISLSVFNSLNFNIANARKLRFAIVLTRNLYNSTVEITDANMSYDTKGNYKELLDNEFDLHLYQNSIQLIPKISVNKILINATL